MAARVNTVDEFKEYYDSLGQSAVEDQDALKPLLRKDAPILVSTTGTRQRTFGRMLWEQVANEAFALGVLPKLDAGNTGGGFRTITARGLSASGGVAEGGATPSTIKPTFATGSFTWKEYAISFDMSTIQASLARTQEDVITWDSIVAYMSEEVALVMNEDILEDLGTLASNDFESLDRFISSEEEVNGNSDHAGATYTANDVDIYGFDRDSGGTFDAYVNENSGTDRGLTIPRLNTLFTESMPYWKSMNNKLLMTGYDAWARLSEIAQGQATFQQTFVTRTVNGITTNAGAEAGWMAGTYRQVPILATNSMLKDTISEFLLVDLDAVGLTFTQPPEYLESRDPQALDKFTVEGVYHAIGELTGFRAAPHAKLRDLNTS